MTAALKTVELPTAAPATTPVTAPVTASATAPATALSATHASINDERAALQQHYLREILLSPVYQAAVETPLQPMAKLSKRLGCQVELKREDHQPVYSFKLRGAFHKLH